MLQDLGRCCTCQGLVRLTAGTSLCNALPLPMASCQKLAGNWLLNLKSTCDCGQVQVLSRDVGHFDVYMGAAFDDVVVEQLAFLQVRLQFLCLAQPCHWHHILPPPKSLLSEHEERCS